MACHQNAVQTVSLALDSKSAVKKNFRIMAMLDVSTSTKWKMSERLYRLLYMWRMCGCLFIASLNPSNLNQARVIWKSFYPVYSLLCGSLLFSFRISDLCLHSLSVSGAQFAVSNFLYTFMKAIISLESVIVFLVMAFRSGAIKRFLRNAQSFERSLVIHRFYRPQRTCLETHVLKASFFAAFVAYTVLLFAFILQLAYRNLGFMQILQYVCSAVSSALFMVCDYGNEATIREICEALVNYVRIQLNVLEQKREFGLTIKDIEDLRISMFTIRSLKEQVNSVLGPCVVLFCLRAFSVVSICAYMIVRLGFTHGIRTFIMFSIMYSLYCLYVAFSLIDLALVSNALEKETGKLKAALALVAATGMSQECVSQINFLYENINPGEMCLTGSGFFVVDSKILLAVAQAAVTYSVILIQTGDVLLLDCRKMSGSNILYENTTIIGGK